MNKKRGDIHKRVWLQPGDPDAMSYAAFTLYNYPGEPTVELKIADCYRHVNIQVCTKRDRKKIDKMIALLQEAAELYDNAKS